MQFTNEVFYKYEKVVYKVVHKICGTFHLEFDDLIGYGMERFCEAVQTYDSEKGSFSTHLTWYLRRLTNYASDMCNDRQKTVSIGGFSYNTTFEDDSYRKTELLDAISRDLSSNSQRFLKDLFMGVFTEPVGLYTKSVTRFPLTKLPKHYGWTSSEVQRVRKEITEWWREY